MLHRLDAHSFRRESWRNGGGITAEIARWPEDTPIYDWRISVAELLHNSAFSLFPGHSRIFTALDAGVRLTINGRVVVAAQLTPIHFSGEADVSCEVEAPARALNVIWRASAGEATVSTTSKSSLRGVVLLFAPENTRVQGAGWSLQLDAGDAVRVRDKHEVFAATTPLVSVAFRT